MSVENNDIDRSLFGPGKAGQLAWEMINSGTLCSVEGCKELAIGTTDFDAIGDLTQIPHCCDDHHREILLIVELQQKAQGRSISPAKNGWGRA